MAYPATKGTAPHGSRPVMRQDLYFLEGGLGRERGFVDVCTCMVW